MKTEDVSKLSAVERFCYWIKERHNIHVRREAGEERPWTDDEVLQSVFFTNPYRENDKTTAWFRQYVRDPLQHDPLVIMATIIFRWFNLITTGEWLRDYPNKKPYGLLQEWDTEKAIVHLNKHKAAGNQIFTGAFIITMGSGSGPKIEYVCRNFIEPMWKKRNDMRSLVAGNQLTMQQFHKYLKQFKGFGGTGFMAYEVVCDLRYTYVLENAPDKELWSNPGPGARRGMNRLLGRDLNDKCLDYQEESQKLLKIVQKRLWGMPYFEMREIEHSLCEFDKAERARLGDGKLKRKYKGV